MAIIPAFPTALPELNDLLLGTKIKEGGNTTKNFRIGEVLALLGNTGLTPASVNYGLFSQTQDSQNITNTITTRALSRGGVGSQIIAANSLVIGDSFNIKAIGPISCLGSTVLTISVTTAGGVILATTGPITMQAATSKNWSIDANITVRAIGGSGIAEVIAGGQFVYGKNSSNVAETLFFLTNAGTGFDTTIPNSIIVTAQWSTASASNSIYSSLYNFTKTY
jgi:hypothetical protein